MLANNLTNSGARKSAGKKLPTLIGLISSKLLIAIPTKSTPPTAVISAII
jgi:hypothetical protein